MSSKKNLSIETLRGIAILLVVIGHVIGSTPDGGMKIDFPSSFALFICVDRLYSDAVVYGYCRMGLCIEAVFAYSWFCGVCAEEGFALAGTNGCGGYNLFLSAIFHAGH